MIIKSKNQKRNNVTNLITAKQFFKDGNNEAGYSFRDNFASLIERLNENQPNDLQSSELLFDAMKDGCIINNGHIQRFDHLGNAYVFPEIQLAKGNHGLKIQVVDDLQKFIRDYQFGKIKPNFTLQELYDEATSSDDDNDALMEEVA